MNKSTVPYDAWADDILDRRADADVMYAFLMNRLADRAARRMSTSYVLNVDAEWGAGKTFFLTRHQQQLRAEGICCVYVNAWVDDHADAPLLALMAAVDSEIKRSFPLSKSVSNAWARVKKLAFPVLKRAGIGALKAAAKKIVGSEAVEEIIGIVSAEDQRDIATSAIDAADVPDAEAAIDVFAASKLQIEKFRSSLSELSKSLRTENPNAQYLFVLVDELDRCRPHYAIKLLEDVKHLFAAEGVVFIIATDTDQLASSVKAIYGADFDAQRYLLRFFDRTYRFSEPSKERLVMFLCQRYGIDKKNLAYPYRVHLIPAISRVFEAFSLSLRDIEQCMDMFASCLTLWDSPAKVNILYLLSLIIAHHLGMKRLFESLETCEPVGWSTHFGEFRKKKFVTFAFGSDQDEFRMGLAKEELHFQTIIGQLLANYRQSATELFETRPDTAGTRWAHQLVREEYNKMHGNIVHHGPLALHLIYVELVRNAGRLQRVKSEDQLSDDNER